MSRTKYIGEIPPEAPREIPRRYRVSMMVSDAWLVGVGVVLLSTSILFCAGIGAVAAGVGSLETWLWVDLGLAIFGLPVFLWRWGKYRRMVRVLANGRSVVGEVVEAGENMKVRVNGRYPWVVRYTFEEGGEAFSGSYQTLDERIGVLRKGNKVHVMYSEEEKTSHTLWPFWRGDLMGEGDRAGKN